MRNRQNLLRNKSLTFWGHLKKWVLFSWQEFWGLSEVQSMCNLGTAIENKGIETGIEIGEKKKAKELAIKLYKKGSSLETISELIEVPVSQLEEWLELQAV